MSEELYELDRAIDHCRDALVHNIPDENVADVPALLQTFHVLREKLWHLELIHRRMHRLRYFSRLIIRPVMRELEKRDPQVRRQLKRELASVFDFDSDSGVPFNLHGVMPQKRLPKGRLAKGQVIALKVGEAVIELARSVQEYLKDFECLKGLEWMDRGPGWPDLLDELTRLHDRALSDYLHPPSEGQEPFEEELARELLSIEEKDRESHGNDKLSDELRHMNPPLTWGEVVYHILQDPDTTEGKRGRALREFLSPFRKRFCLECDELFTVSKSSLRLICPRCSTKLRKRRERERKRASL